MPVVRHEAIGRDADAGSCHGFLEDLLEGGVVGRFLEERQATDAAVQDVIGEPTGSEARAARHADSSKLLPYWRSRKDSRPLLSSQHDLSRVLRERGVEKDKIIAHSLIT